ncbi:18603_t:CDS:2 [Funneliformis geosporum]|uniref:18603_t:CDS:1 n=1 Tax=Funneliformis geosporum TaxID=1117311 RepID=A0A9W4T1B6_9GLOM|nr:18603_t:CDS:2 [Funneliformis geosporum]
MTSVKLNWLIYGEDPYEKVSQVDIDTSERVIALKKAIKKDISESVSARDLKVFKVDISLGEARNEDAVLMCKTDLSIIGQEMNNNLQKIGVYFNVQPVETNLHIFVQLPTVVTGLRRMTYTALIEEQLSNLSIFGEPSTATTTDDVEISSGLSIPAKRPLLDRSFLDRTCKKKRGGQ